MYSSLRHYNTTKSWALKIMYNHILDIRRIVKCKIKTDPRFKGIHFIFKFALPRKKEWKRSLKVMRLVLQDQIELYPYSVWAFSEELIRIHYYQHSVILYCRFFVFCKRIWCIWSSLSAQSIQTKKKYCYLYHNFWGKAFCSDNLFNCFLVSVQLARRK